MASAAVLWIFIGLLVFMPSASHGQPTLDRLTVAPESRCTPYSRDDYPYPASIEKRIVQTLGGVYGPYTDQWFNSARDTDIEHIVALSEAHDSGLCEADAATRKQFASDMNNLTLAAPDVNRCVVGGKCGYDAAEWLPPKNWCWFAARIIAVKTAYSLTIDDAEADALDAVLQNCSSFDLIVTPPPHT